MKYHISNADISMVDWEITFNIGSCTMDERNLLLISIGPQ